MKSSGRHPGSLQESVAAGECAPVLSAVRIRPPATVGSLRLTHLQLNRSKL